VAGTGLGHSEGLQGPVVRLGRTRQTSFFGSSLTRIIHDGSSRNGGVAWRDGRVEARDPEAYLKQYVEGSSGEPARLHTAETRVQACRSSKSAIVVETFMNNAG
jgi:hypothetical protein